MMVNDAKAPRMLTGYTPNITVAGIEIGIFAILSGIYWFRLRRHGSAYMLVLCSSATMMLLGLCVRIPMTKNTDSLGLYIAQYVAILLSSYGLTANCYILVTRLASWVEVEDCLFLRSSVRIFIWSDVITFALQGIGGCLTAIDTQRMAYTGQFIALLGIMIATLSFMLFIILVIVFGFKVYPNKWSNIVRANRGSGPGSCVNIRLRRLEDWRSVYWALLWSATGILVRCLFRVTEYAQGYDPDLIDTQYWLYIFDTLPLALGIAVWAIVWPPKVLEEQVEFVGTDEHGSGHDYHMNTIDLGSKAGSQDSLIYERC